MVETLRQNRIVTLAKALACAGAALSLSLTAQGEGTTSINTSDTVEYIKLPIDGQPYTGEVAIPAGKSTLLTFDRPIAEALVGSPDAADIIPLTERSIYILGKQIGATNLTLLGSDKSLLGVVDVQVTYDVTNLKKRLHELLPDSAIEVRTNGTSLLLSGVASDSAQMARAVDLAGNYAPGSVVNMINVASSQQVMLAVRFAEVERTAAKELGISTNAFFQNSDGDIVDLASSFASSQLSSPNFTQLFGQFTAGQVTVDLLLDALEEKGVATVLAEPTLIARSGEAASFLAGGEFPIPVGVDSFNGVNASTNLEIEFREFGVRLDFTPTVIGDTISLTVTPEVSELDPASGIEISGFVIPGLQTRRATTTVELKNGQSFAVAGLLQKSFIDSLDQFPGASNVPILGSLLRSASFKREETELAIIITPYIVKPSDASTGLALPTDFFKRPHELELFFLGRVESKGRFAEGRGINRIVSSNTTGSAGDPLGYIIQ